MWNPEFKLLTAEMSAPDNLALRLFNYPAWRVEVNGRLVQAATREGTGQMLVPVEAGVNRLQITFVRTWDRRVGGWISLVTIVVVLVSLKTVAPASRRLFGKGAPASSSEPAEGAAAETAALPES
jgi:hypothetical protein